MPTDTDKVAIRGRPEVGRARSKWRDWPPPDIAATGFGRMCRSPAHTGPLL